MNLAEMQRVTLPSTILNYTILKSMHTLAPDHLAKMTLKSMAEMQVITKSFNTLIYLYISWKLPFSQLNLYADIYKDSWIVTASETSFNHSVGFT